jgi:hypothetical protein
MRFQLLSRYIYQEMGSKKEFLDSNPAEGRDFSVRHRLQTESGGPTSLLFIWYKKKYSSRD